MLIPTYDPAWLADLRPELQPAAKRHGQELLTFVLENGSMNYAINLIAQRARGNAEILQAAGVIATQLNSLALNFAALKGWDMAKIREVQRDVEVAASLASVGQGKIVVAQ